MSEFKKPTAFVDVPCEWVSATSQAEGVPANFVIEHYDDEQLAEANEVLALIVARLSRENAKLRELCKDMMAFVEVDDACERCGHDAECVEAADGELVLPYEGQCLMLDLFADRMRELGVETDV